MHFVKNFSHITTANNGITYILMFCHFKMQFFPDIFECMTERTVPDIMDKSRSDSMLCKSSIELLRC